MRLTKDHLKSVQIELFFNQLNALKREEQELFEQFYIARNLACSEWEYGLVATSGGGSTGLRVTRMIPGQMELLKKNFDQHREDLSYRRYALYKVYLPIIKERVKDLNDMGEYKELDEIVEYWEKQKTLPAS